MRLDPSRLEKVLERFECQQCNECCKKPGYVYLRPDEADGIAGFLGLDPRDFIDEHCELLDKRQLVLKKNPDESCIFLTNEGCRVHPVKPQQCRDFPVKWRTEQSLSYCAGLKKLGLDESAVLKLTTEDEMFEEVPKPPRFGRKRYLPGAVPLRETGFDRGDGLG